MRRGTPLGLLLLAGLLTAGQQTQAQQTQSRTRAQPQTLTVKATPKTVVWGYYDAAAPPVLRVASGKEVTNKGPGGHILNGPVFVEGAEPGDALEVRIQ